MSPGAGLEEHEPNSSSAACYLARALGVSHGRDRVRLRMHGEIRLGSWRAFRARQVTVAGRGMVWEASVRMMGLTVRGYDRLLDGRGEMLWKLLGLVP